MTEKDGGPAFPRAPVPEGYEQTRFEGMSLRDWFAAHADQPGQAEIATAAGLRLEGQKIWLDETNCIGTWGQWWAGLSNTERFDLSSKVRYQQADAMLAARGQDDG